MNLVNKVPKLTQQMKRVKLLQESTDDLKILRNKRPKKMQKLTSQKQLHSNLKWKPIERQWFKTGIEESFSKRREICLDFSLSEPQNFHMALFNNTHEKT